MDKLSSIRVSALCIKARCQFDSCGKTASLNKEAFFPAIIPFIAAAIKGGLSTGATVGAIASIGAPILAKLGLGAKWGLPGMKSLAAAKKGLTGGSLTAAPFGAAYGGGTYAGGGKDLEDLRDQITRSQGWAHTGVGALGGAGAGALAGSFFDSPWLGAGIGATLGGLGGHALSRGQDYA